MLKRFGSGKRLVENKAAVVQTTEIDADRTRIDAEDAGH
jgi:hypothetical protein